MGNPVADGWVKAECKVSLRGRLWKGIPDLMDFGGFIGIAITSRARDLLEDLLLPSCELLPMGLKGTAVYLINPTTVLDCIDYERSVTEKAESFYMERISRFAFRKDVEYPAIFKVKNKYERWPRDIFADDRLIRRLEENALTGYETEEVWDSERE